MKAKMLGAALAAVLSTAAGGAGAQEVVLKVHHFLGPQAPQHAKVLAPWCDKLAKDSGDRLKCQIFPAMQLGGAPPQLYDQARDGVADITLMLAGYAANRFPRLEVFELPFMMSNAEATSRAAWEYYETQAKDELAETRPVALFVHGPGNIYTTKKPIKTLADFRGMKLRAPTRQTNKLLALMGASPVGMPVPAVPEAISKGVIDGAVIPYEVAPSVKMNELVKYTAETDRSFPALYTAVFLLTMNKAKYESLPADLKQIFDANAGLVASGQFGKAMMEADVPGKEKMVSSGVEISVIPRIELEKWRAASASLDDAWAKDMDGRGFDGKKLLQSAQELIKKHSN